MTTVARLAAGMLAVSVALACGPGTYAANASASSPAGRTDAPAVPADLPANVSVSFTADTTTSFSCSSNWPATTSCNPPNWAAVLSQGSSSLSYTEQAQGSLASSIPIDDTGQGSAPLTESGVSVAGTGTWNETIPAQPPLSCQITATSGTVSTGAVNPGTMQDILIPVTDSGGKVTDFLLSVTTPTEPTEVENWSWDQTATPLVPDPGPECVSGSFPNSGMTESNAIDDIYADAVYDNTMNTNSQFTLSGWSINPAWTEAEGGVWATKTINETIPYNFLNDPNELDKGTIQVAETYTISTKAANLVIVSPPPDSIIAVTDGKYVTPQPGPNGRAPASRSLIVRGTSQCPAVTVNNVPAAMTGKAWQVDIPITGTGQLGLDASAPGCSDATESLTLINLHITSPAENAVMPVSAAATMPALNAKVSVDGFTGSTSAQSFTWALNMRGQERGTKGWRQYQQAVATGSTLGTAAWRPKYTTVLGGWGRLTATANLPGVLDDPVTSDPRWVSVPGTNPSRPSVASFIGINAGKLATVVEHIDCLSGFRQFSPTADPREPASTNIPADIKPDPAPLRPLLVRLPAAIGISQINPAAFPAQQWNWQANVQAGIKAFQAAYTAALGARAAAQYVLDHQRAAVLSTVNALRKKKGLPLISVKRIVVPAMTAAELERDAISRYHSGPEYYFNAQYVEGANLTVKITGTRQWAVTKQADPRYAQQVLACHI